MIRGKLHDIGVGNYVMDIKMFFKSTEKKNKIGQRELYQTKKFLRRKGNHQQSGKIF